MRRQVEQLGFVTDALAVLDADYVASLGNVDPVGIDEANVRVPVEKVHQHKECGIIEHIVGVEPQDELPTRHFERLIGAPPQPERRWGFDHANATGMGVCEASRKRDGVVVRAFGEDDRLPGVEALRRHAPEGLIEKASVVSARHVDGDARRHHLSCCSRRGRFIPHRATRRRGRSHRVTVPPLATDSRFGNARHGARF